MEQETVLNEILHELRRHSSQMNEKMDNMRNDLESKIDGVGTDLETKIDNMRIDLESKIDSVESKMDKGFDRLGKKVDGVRVDLTETQETADYVLSKAAHHEKKLRQLSELHP